MRTPLGVTKVSDPLFFYIYIYIIFTKYWDVESKNLDAYEILDEGALAAFKRVEVRGVLRGS